MLHRSLNRIGFTVCITLQSTLLVFCCYHLFSAQVNARIPTEPLDHKSNHVTIIPCSTLQMVSCPLRTLYSPQHGTEVLSKPCLGPFVYHLMPTTLAHICLLQPYWPPCPTYSASGLLYFLFLCLKMSFLTYLCGLLILFKSLLKCHLLRFSRIPHLKHMTLSFLSMCPYPAFYYDVVSLLACLPQ